MDLIEKFGLIKVNATDRITAEDLRFCEVHQAAYEAAIQTFKELSFLWNDAVKMQKELLQEVSQSIYDHLEYLTSSDGPRLSEDKISAHIFSLHKQFIHVIVHYFNAAYHVSLSDEDVCARVLPQKPRQDWPRDQSLLTAYTDQMFSHLVCYQDVVDELILQLEGQSFADRAFYELTQKCQKAAWFLYPSRPRFNRKKRTISFTGHWCEFRQWGTYSRLTLSQGIQSILLGIAHFETGSYSQYPAGLSELLEHGDHRESTYDFPTCKKVCQFKMFKNGRVDIKFASEAHAAKFEQDYLGLAC